MQIVFTNDEVENICRYYKNNPKQYGEPPKDYFINAFKALNIEITDKKLDAVTRIIYKKAYRNISDKYF